MQNKFISRRHFLNQSSKMAALGFSAASGLWLGSCAKAQETSNGSEPETTTAPQAATPLFFSISLAQWSLHKSLFSGQLDHLDFAAKTKNDFGIDAVEYVNIFFKDRAKDLDYLGEMKKRTDDLGVQNVLIMIDGEGLLAHESAKERQKSVENHYKWVEAAKFLGCHAIRVNAARAEGTAEEVAEAAVESLHSLSTFAQPYGISVIVENHGWYSSDGEWLAGVIGKVGLPNCGTLPDFGNFRWDYQSDERVFDRYTGVAAMMPYAKGVSAKSHNFDDQGFETETDYRKMLQIVKNAGYTGYIGIEYEGEKLSEDEGIRATKVLLEKVGAELSV
jgi:sugar phosphate isomerase/epimerase